MVTRGEGWRGGIVREFGIGMYTLLYVKWITNKDLLYSTGKKIPIAKRHQQLFGCSSNQRNANKNDKILKKNKQKLSALSL